MKHFSHLNTAVQLLELYKGEEPFGSFLKKYFGQNKKYGSRDRKQISQLCYSYFRLGKALLSVPVEERVLTGLFLCTNISHELLQAIRPEWNKVISDSLEEKCKKLDIDLSSLTVFPWSDEMSEGVNADKFNSSFFIQPDLFLRIRPGKEEAVIAKLKKMEINFKQISPSCISLANGSKIETIIDINKEAVVQDRSSQQVASFLPAFQIPVRPAVWDCCAASGGKSIMAIDTLKNIDLTVSDIRESILINLEKRFREAGINGYKSFVADLTSPLDSKQLPKPSSFDLIIADVPCTGSGTWGRTPEQLFYFDTSKINEYVAKQKAIVSAVMPSLKPGGYFLYITCSVFKKENEEMILFIKDQHLLHPIKTEVINGYDHKADTMFAGLMQKPLHEG